MNCPNYAQPVSRLILPVLTLSKQKYVLNPDISGAASWALVSMISVKIKCAHLRPDNEKTKSLNYKQSSSFVGYKI
jgi:hypothetical protein